MSLSRKEVDLIISIIHSVVSDAEIFLFGSRASGRERADSDVDIAIRSRIEVTFEQILELKYLFSESDLPFFVDLVDLSVIDSCFRDAIANDLVPLVTH